MNLQNGDKPCSHNNVFRSHIDNFNTNFLQETAAKHLVLVVVADDVLERKATLNDLRYFEHFW